MTAGKQMNVVRLRDRVLVGLLKGKAIVAQYG